MGEHDPLRVRRGSRGIEQGREIAIGGDDRLKASGASGKDGINIGGKAFCNSQALDATVSAFCAAFGAMRGSRSSRIRRAQLRGRRSHHQSQVESLDRLRRHGKMLHIAEQKRSFAIDQQLLDLVGMESSVERNRSPPTRDDA